MSSKGNLYLIPNVISDNTHDKIITPQMLQTLPLINYFLVEDIRTARRFLSSLKVYSSIEALRFEVLNKDTTQEQIERMLRPVFDGENAGIISESGCPGIADPGSIAVRLAHHHHIKVVPLVGPSSILLALMGSGLNGQQFAFHGYLPIGAESINRIRELEKESAKKKQTQIFIETPYRNNSILQNLLKTLNKNTSLTIALDVTGESEMIKTKKVSEWRLENITLPKFPAVFLFLAD